MHEACSEHVQKQHAMSHPASAQAAANAFAADFEAVLQLLEAAPLAPVPGHGSAPLNCIRLCVLRYAYLAIHMLQRDWDAGTPPTADVALQPTWAAGRSADAKSSVVTARGW